MALSTTLALPTTNRPRIVYIPPLLATETTVSFIAFFVLLAACATLPIRLLFIHHRHHPPPVSASGNLFVSLRVLVLTLGKYRFVWKRTSGSQDKEDGSEGGHNARDGLDRNNGRAQRCSTAPASVLRWRRPASTPSSHGYPHPLAGRTASGPGESPWGLRHPAPALEASAEVRARLSRSGIFDTSGEGADWHSLTHLPRFNTPRQGGPPGRHGFGRSPGWRSASPPFFFSPFGIQGTAGWS